MPEPVPHSGLRADTRFDLAPGVMLQKAPDGAILLNLRMETMYSLNATGARAVALAAEGIAFEGIIERLAAEYQADATEVARAVTELFTSLMDVGLLIEGTGQ